MPLLSLRVVIMSLVVGAGEGVTWGTVIWVEVKLHCRG